MPTLIDYAIAFTVLGKPQSQTAETMVTISEPQRVVVHPRGSNHPMLQGALNGWI